MTATNAHALIDAIVAADERLDAPAFAALLAEDGTFRIGARPAIHGRDAVQAYVTQFFTGLRSLRHEIERTWPIDDALIYTATVHYELLDGRRLSLPYANVLQLGDGGVRDYRVYIDLAPLHREARS